MQHNFKNPVKKLIKFESRTKTKAEIQAKKGGFRDLNHFINEAILDAIYREIKHDKRLD